MLTDHVDLMQGLLSGVLYPARGQPGPAGSPAVAAAGDGHIRAGVATLRQQPDERRLLGLPAYWRRNSASITASPGDMVVNGRLARAAARWNATAAGGQMRKKNFNAT